MKRLNVNFPQLIYQLIPPHKRQQVRVKSLQILTNLTELYKEFAIWRSEQRRLYNTTAQTILLERYLRYKFGEPKIYIRTRTDDWVAISLLIENQWIAVGFKDEIVEFMNDPEWISFPLIGEMLELYKDKDYIVRAPDSIDEELLIIEIEKFNVIDKKYRIIQE